MDHSLRTSVGWHLLSIINQPLSVSIILHLKIFLVSKMNGIAHIFIFLLLSITNIVMNITLEIWQWLLFQFTMNIGLGSLGLSKQFHNCYCILSSCPPFQKKHNTGNVYFITMHHSSLWMEHKQCRFCFINKLKNVPF